MPPVDRHLVQQYLEHIAASVFEQHKDIVAEYTRRQPGIYALYKNDRLYYIGLARNLRARLKQHVRDRHRGRWNRFSFYLLRDHSHLKELESLLLRIVKPTGNTVIGRLPRSQNLRHDFAARLKAQLRQQFDDLIGRQARNADADEPPAVLARYIHRFFWLRGEHNGKRYRAFVRRDGWIRYRGWLYRSPSTLAGEILGHKSNGWHFWHYQQAPRHWVRLSHLRRQS